MASVPSPTPDATLLTLTDHTSPAEEESGNARFQQAGLAQEASRLQTFSSQSPPDHDKAVLLLLPQSRCNRCWIPVIIPESNRKWMSLHREIRFTAPAAGRNNSTIGGCDPNGPHGNRRPPIRFFALRQRPILPPLRGASAPLDGAGLDPGSTTTKAVLLDTETRDQVPSHTRARATILLGFPVQRIDPLQQSQNVGDRFQTCLQRTNHLLQK